MTDSTPAVAFDGTDYMVAWKSERELWAIRYGVDGSRIGPELKLGADIPDRYTAIDLDTYRRQLSVANIGDKYLVTYRSEYDADNRYDIGATLFLADGTVLRRFLLTDAIRGQEHPLLATDGVNFVVVWRDPITRRGPADLPSVFVARVTPDGTLLDPGGVDLGMDNSYDPIGFAYGDGVFMVRAGDVARTFTSDLTPSPVFSVGGSGQLVSDGTNFLHAIIDAGDNVDLELLSSSGVVIASVSDVLSGVDALKLSSNGTGFQLASLSAGDVSLTQVASDLSALDPSVLVRTNQECLSLATTPAQAFVASCDVSMRVDLAHGRAAVGQRVDLATGTVLDVPPSIIARRNSLQTIGGIAENGEDYMVAYGDDRRAAFASRVSGAGDVLGEFELADQEVTPSIAENAGEYMSVWVTGGGLHWVKLDSSGAELASGVVATSALFASIAPAGSGYAVALWGSGVSVATLSATGALGSPVFVASDLADEARARAVEVASLGDRLLLTWFNDADELRGQVFNDSLATVGSELTLGTTSGDAFSFSEVPRHPIATSDDLFFATWEDRTATPATDTNWIRGARVSRDGLLMDVAPTSLLRGCVRPTVTFDGVRFLAIAERTPPSGTRIRGSYVGTDGERLGSVDGTELISVDGDLRVEALASVRDGTAMFVYRAIEQFSDEVRFRILGPGGVAVGSMCAENVDCGSGFCVDGVCCESACVGTCDACGEAGMEGECVSISGAPRGDRDGCLMCVDGVCDDGMPGGLGEACGADAECVSGECVDGFCCERACRGTCKACDVAGSEGMCTPISGAPHGDREGCVECDAGACADSTTMGELGDVCTTDVECDAGHCVDGVCCERACAGTCKACGEPGSEGLCTPISGAPRGGRDGCTTCDDGVCDDGGGAGLLGVACALDSDCDSGACTDGVCCERACRGTCKACAEPGFEGMCIPVSGPPRGDRDDCSFCDEGVCSEAGTLGSACTDDATCDSGFCVDGVCCERACRGTCKACGEPGSEGQCTPISGAPRGDRDECSTCDSGVCVGADPLGTACGTADDCESGQCVDGVCCERACRGDCKACGEPGFEGMCIPVSGAPRGDRDGCLTCDVGVCAD